MKDWKFGDLLKSKETGQYIYFKRYNSEHADWFVGTDKDGITYNDWLIHKFEKVEVPNEKN